MPTTRRRIGWIGCTFYLLLAVAGSLAIWFWPQFPRWRMIVPNPEKNTHKVQLLFFSDDSHRVFFLENNQDKSQSSVTHYDSHTGQLLERVELWRERHENTGMFPPIILGFPPNHNNRTLYAHIMHTDNSRDIEFYDVSDGKIKAAPFRINEAIISISQNRRWVYYFSLNQRPKKTPDVGNKCDLVIADFKTGEIVLQFKPVMDPASKTLMSYGWEAVFDPTECFVALAWNSPAIFSSEDVPENHQSQIRIYDLQTRKEIRRITLPPGSSWSVKSWEENQLWLQRLWVEPLDKIRENNYVTYSQPARLALEPIHPQPIEYPQFLDTQTPKNQSMEFNTHRRYPQGVLLNHQWWGKKWDLPKVLQKIIEWFPSTKDKIDEFYPEKGMNVTLLDRETGQNLWECRRTFFGGFDLSPDGQSLISNSIKNDSFVIEMWDTHYPRRWLEVLGFNCVVGLWCWWRSRKTYRTGLSSPPASLDNPPVPAQ